MGWGCGDCEDKKYRHHYSHPHPDRFYWYCNKVKRELEIVGHGEVSKDVMCPKLLSQRRVKS